MQSDMSNIERIATVRRFIVESLLYGDDRGLTAETPLFDQNIVDSMGLVELIGFLEETYNITVEDQELAPQNFASLGAIDEFLARKIGASGNLAG